MNRSVLAVLLTATVGCTVQKRVAAVPTLTEALLEDMLPPSSSLCAGGGTTAFTFNFTSTRFTSKWDEVAYMFEEGVFLAEMSHTDTNTNRNWTLHSKSSLPCSA